jgi:hypothetical protein
MEVVVSRGVLGHLSVLLANLFAQILEVDQLQDLSHRIPPPSMA